MPASDRAGDIGRVLAGAGAMVAADVTYGLERAWQAAGGVLGDIFGGFPAWMDPAGIVDAVAGGAGQIGPLALDALAYVTAFGGMA